MGIERREGYWLWVGGPVPPGASAITIGAVVSVRRGAAGDATLLRHELVHVRQWRELGAARFLGRYVASYLRWRLRGYPHWGAYRRIPLEIEAFWLARRAGAAAAGVDTSGRGQRAGVPPAAGTPEGVEHRG